MQRAQILLAATIMAGATTGAADAASVERNFPARPVRLVVGFPPAGGTDMMARIIAPITVVGSVPHVLVVHPSVEAKTVKELIALAKNQPGQFTFPSAGNGTPPHLSGEIFKLMTGVDMQHVPYKGSGQSVADLIAGQVSLSFDSTPTVPNYIKAAKLRID
jgi:tripartite-type tricarboxylate transporter receptor subunit TctC